MKLIKKLWELKKLLGFTFINMILYLLVLVARNFIELSILWGIGYVLLHTIANLSFPDYLPGLALMLFVKICVKSITPKIKNKNEDYI